MSIFNDIVNNLGLKNIFGTDTSKNDAAARDAMNAALNQYNIPLPELQKLTPENYTYSGDLSPQMVNAGQDISYDKINPTQAQLSNVNDTSLANISSDPRLKNDQMAALDALKAISEGGGLTAADKANLNQIQNESAQADRGRREAILQNMQQRGMAGSGQSLLAQLQSSQAATDRANQAGLDIAGQAQQRALDAIMQGGQLAGNLRSQNYGEQANLAAARDAINKFNAQNANQMNQFNVNALNNAALNNAANQYQAAAGNRAANYNANVANTNAINQANAANLANRQNINNANVDINNQAQQANAQLPQQNFQNQMNLAAGKSGQLQNQAAYQTSLGDRKAKKEGELIGAATKIGASLIK